MRLLNVHTLKLETFYEPDVPTYAALSHTWGKDEVTFQDLEAGLTQGSGWIKICQSAAQARQYSCNYIWIDTCCIDKTSSAELSEAINSMYRWYRDCTVCIAYLEDVSEIPAVSSDLVDDGCKEAVSPLSCYPTFSHARWFRRGWTLQELIAPQTLHFYDTHWNKIAEKRDIIGFLSRVTGIDILVLHEVRSLYTKSIAQKMSWASQRETTRIEDLAYCLMGIFDINMPLLYGEGQRAFIRLQEEIMKRKYDHSLFAWNYNGLTPKIYGTSFRGTYPFEGVGVLAPHPSAFSHGAMIVPHPTRSAPYATTNRGLEIFLRILIHTSENQVHTHIGVLECFCYKDRPTTVVAIPLQRVMRSGDLGQENEFYRTEDDDLVHIDGLMAAQAKGRLVYLS
jgi:hypothetical protein